MLAKALAKRLGTDVVITDFERRFALSTDASYFRIVPEIIVTVGCLDELRDVLDIAYRYKSSVTFRAAGTSLSGQSIGPGILVFYRGADFEHYEHNTETNISRLGVNLRGQVINDRLKILGRKIGPDPATINIAKLGGILANNSSGMCCGTQDNAYQTLKSMKVMLGDGAVLDTSNSASIKSFRLSHHRLLESLSNLAKSVSEDRELSDMIERKYRIKNTMGYSLNALIDFNDPIDILSHLMIGSEGTLGFVQEVELATVSLPRHRACALMAFDNISSAAAAITKLKAIEVNAAELLDWSSIRAIQSTEGMPSWLSELQAPNALLLVEIADASLHGCRRKVAQLIDSPPSGLTRSLDFSFDEIECASFWKVRSGIFPRVGALRAPGSTVIIEDVAVPFHRLAELVDVLIMLFKRYGYNDAVIFGHALDGNLHFIVTPNLNIPDQVDQFADFMENVTEHVISLGGSLKAEHGTGRAMAPFVEREWGQRAYELMKQIKHLFDPQGLLNPDVIINKSEHAHREHLKSAKRVNEQVDRCIDCGFCEPSCPTNGITFSPRQRIAAVREGLCADYEVDISCIRCEMCEDACPVGINTAVLVQSRRNSQLGYWVQRLSELQSRYFNIYLRVFRGFIRFYHWIPKQLIRAVSKYFEHQNIIPRWLPNTRKSRVNNQDDQYMNTDVVFLESCADRLFGDADGTSSTSSLKTLADAAGIKIGHIRSSDSMCCGQLWDMKGNLKVADDKRRELADALSGFKGVLVTDALSCSKVLQASLTGLRVMDPITWLHSEVVPKLTFKNIEQRVVVHRGCTARKLNINEPLIELAQKCSSSVSWIEHMFCCGGGGVVQFFEPQISDALHLGLDLEYRSVDADIGVYANVPCEANLSRLSGVKHIHIAKLLEASLLIDGN